MATRKRTKGRLFSKYFQVDMYFVLDYRQGNGHKKKNKRTNNGIHKQQKTEQYDVDLQRGWTIVLWKGKQFCLDIQDYRCSICL